MIELWFWLIVAFQIKHFLVDYILQRGFAKFSADWRVWIPGLLVHAGMHVIGTFIILAPISGVFIAANLALFNGGVHFIMDRLKASPNLWGREGRWIKSIENREVYVGDDDDSILTKHEKYFQTKPQFWWALGFDQMIHHLTDLVCVLWVV